MCGVCGVVLRDRRSSLPDRKTRERMTQVLRHRGPDDEGWHLGPGVAIGMRRLSVIDPAHSAQPLSNEDGTVQAVLNGEIYNYRRLRDELDRGGHHLKTAGDGESIVHLYETYGCAVPRHLRGMFAFALWDETRRRLVLARDRLGIKPLYYVAGDFGLAFASEVKALIAGGFVDPALHRHGAELFLAFGYVPGPYTLFEGVRKLMPASVLVCEDGRITAQHQYWSPWEEPQIGVGCSWNEDQERLLEKLRDAVRAEMVSDVPVGVMLSGGLDSSLLAALMSEHSSRPVQTFSIGFSDQPEANELAEARQVAERLGTQHHELVMGADEQPELLDEALWHLEDPIADLSCIGFLLLSRLARQSVTVALCGQGADELLGGYRKHQVAAAAGWMAQLPEWAATVLRQTARFGHTGSAWSRGITALTTSDPVDRLLAMSQITLGRDSARLLSPQFVGQNGADSIAGAVAQHLPDQRLTVLGEVCHLDARLALVDLMLHYFDRMSMATSLEVRVPFLDHHLVSFCSALADSRRVRVLRRKELLKRASKGLVDDSIIHKRKLGFFRWGLSTWLDANRDTLVRDVLLDGRTQRRGQYQLTSVSRLIDGAGRNGRKHDEQIFCLLLLELWQRFWVDGDGAGRRQALGSKARKAVLA